MAYKPAKKKPMAEINVVPYIDVMLVLLVIFMITAPLLTQGVKVDLPQANAEAIPDEELDPVVVSLDAGGRYYVDLGGENQPLDPDQVSDRVYKVLKQKPDTPVLLRADRGLDYGVVMDAMVRLQSAGVPSVGLVTEAPDS